MYDFDQKEFFTDPDTSKDNPSGGLGGESTQSEDEGSEMSDQPVGDRSPESSKRGNKISP